MCAQTYTRFGKTLLHLDLQREDFRPIVVSYNVSTEFCQRSPLYFNGRSKGEDIISLLIAARCG